MLIVLFYSICPIDAQTFDYESDTVRVSQDITLNLKSGSFDIMKDRTGEEFIKMEGFGLTSSPGEPVLPFRIYDVVVPPNIDWKTIDLKFVRKGKQLPDKHSISPAPPLRARVDDKDLIDWGEGKEIVDGKNILVYTKKEFYPKTPVSILSYSQMRKWKFVRIGFTPVQYNPVTGDLYLIDSAEVKILFQRFGTRMYRMNPVLKDTLMDKEARQKFINIKDAYEWYRFLPVPHAREEKDDSDYVIITTNAIVEGSGAVLSDFVNHKMNLGHTVRIVTEDDYGSLTGQSPNGTAEKIRQWLKNNYVSLGINWVLLIGDPDPDDPIDPDDSVGDIPMKMFWPLYGIQLDYDESPSDYFYADLTGDWNIDGDNFFGESVSTTNPNTPAPEIDPGTFSVIWTGKIKIEDDTDSYDFRTCSEGGILFLSLEPISIVSLEKIYNS